MMRLWWFALFLCFLGAVAAPPLNSSNDDAYYWKDFDGSIPSDAVSGGKDKQGKTTYIGHAHHTNGALIPGLIDASKKALVYHYDAKGYTVSRNVQILCSSNKDRFEWIKTNDVDLRFLTQKHLVPGGFDDDYPLLIGRAEKSGEVVVGKITVYHGYKGFTYVVDGTAPHEHHNYEVLSYNDKRDCKSKE